MFQIFTVVLRESLEIFLILGIIFAALPNIRSNISSILTGILMGVMGSIGIALFASKISDSFDGMGQEIFNIILLSLTIAMIMVTIIWIKDRTKQIKHDIKSHHTKWSLILMIAALIFREGSEIALFLMSIIAVNSFSFTEILISSILGFGCGMLIAYSLYFGLFNIAGKKIFKITSILLMLIAANLSSEVANLIISADLIDIGSEIFWDSSWLIADTSILGKSLNLILGYTATPTTLQIIFYILTLLMIVFLMKMHTIKCTMKKESSTHHRTFAVAHAMSITATLDPLSRFITNMKRMRRLLKNQ